MKFEGRLTRQHPASRAFVLVLACTLLTNVVWGGASVNDSSFQIQDSTQCNSAHSVLFRFAMRGLPPGTEDVVAATSDPAVIQRCEEQLLLPADQRRKFIIGPIAAGNGGHNLGWGWHFVPDSWSLADFSIELCDGSPHMVEADLDYWLNVVGTFCPWSSYVASEALPCCVGLAGNVDCDPTDGADISDLTALIDNLYLSFTPLCCPAEANTDGSVDGNVDISDLTALIDYLYISFTPTAACL